MSDDIQSPIVRELTAALGRQLGERGHAKATYVWRATSNFIDDFVDVSTGVTDIPVVGTVANRLYANTDEPSRAYQAVIVQSEYRLLPRVKQIAWDRTVTVDAASARDANGIPTGFVRGPGMGRPRATTSSRNRIWVRTEAAPCGSRSECGCDAELECLGFRVPGCLGCAEGAGRAPI